MKLLSDRFPLEAFWARVRSSERSRLLLDYDGTLAPFHPQRDLATPYPGVRERLERLMALERTSIALVSGRAIHDLVPLLGMESPPEIWGSHGWEHRTREGQTATAAISDAQASGISRAIEAASRAGLAGCCERKPAGAALHWRNLPGGPDARWDALALEWARIASGSGLESHPFNGGLELRLPGVNKSLPVREALKDSDAVAYLGDDLTDEDALAALADIGLGVLVASVPRESHAALWIRPPEELLAFLDRWIGSST